MNQGIAAVLLRVAEWLEANDIPYQVTGELAAWFYGSEWPVGKVTLQVLGSDVEAVTGSLGEDAGMVELRPSAGRIWDARRGRWVGFRANLNHSTWMDWRGFHLPVEPRGCLLRRWEIEGKEEELRAVLAAQLRELDGASGLIEFR